MAMVGKQLLIFLIVLSCFSGCDRMKSISNPDVLAKVNDKVLTRIDVENRIPKGLESSDSLLFAENIIQKWVKDVLILEVATRNLGDEKTEINRLVEEYRQSLIRYRYQDRVQKEKFRTDIRESDKLNFYEENQSKFILEKSLIKGLFLKIPIDAPALDDVKKWYKQTNTDALEKIEKYSLQNATLYDYFYDRWIESDEIIENIPLRIANVNQYLKNNKQIEVADSSYCYLLNVAEYIPSGNVAPYEYVNTQIMDMLMNQRKIQFWKDFEDELYRDAMRSGKVQITTEL